MDDRMVSEEYTVEMMQKYNDFHAGNGPSHTFFWPLAPPPSSHGWIYMPGTCSGWWAHRYETLQKKLIVGWQYLDAIEKALDHGYRV